MIKTSGTSFRILLLLLVISTSCKKNNQSSMTPPPASGAFSFKVDGGATVTLDSANATLYTVNNAREIDVYGFKGGKQLI